MRQRREGKEKYVDKLAGERVRRQKERERKRTAGVTEEGEWKKYKEDREKNCEETKGAKREKERYNRL